MHGKTFANLVGPKGAGGSYIVCYRYTISGDGGLGAGGRGEGAGDGRGRLVTGPGASCLVRWMTYSRQWASHAESMMNQGWIGLRLGLGLGIAFGVAKQG